MPVRDPGFAPRGDGRRAAHPDLGGVLGLDPRRIGRFRAGGRLRAAPPGDIHRR